MYLRIESNVCSRSHGHPPGARSRVIISTAREKACCSESGLLSDEDTRWVVRTDRCGVSFMLHILRLDWPIRCCRLRVLCVYCGCVPFAASIPALDPRDAQLCLPVCCLAVFSMSASPVCPAHQSIVTPCSHCLRCSTSDPRTATTFRSSAGYGCVAVVAPAMRVFPFNIRLVELGTAVLFVACVLHTGADLADAGRCRGLLSFARAGCHGCADHAAAGRVYR